MQPSHHDPGFPSPRPVLFSTEPGHLSSRTCSWLPFQSSPSSCSCLEHFLHCCSRRLAQCWHFSVPWGPFDLSALSCPPRSFFSVNNTQHLQVKALPLRVDVQNALFWKQSTKHTIIICFELDRWIWISYFVDTCCKTQKGMKFLETSQKKMPWKFPSPNTERKRRKETKNERRKEGREGTRKEGRREKNMAVIFQLTMGIN